MFYHTQSLIPSGSFPLQRKKKRVTVVERSVDLQNDRSTAARELSYLSSQFLENCTVVCASGVRPDDTYGGSVGTACSFEGF